MEKPFNHQQYLNLSSELVRFASRWVPPDDAEDIVQNTLSIFSRRQNTGCIKNPRAYLRKMVRRAIIDWGRKRNRWAGHRSDIPAAVPPQDPATIVAREDLYQQALGLLDGLDRHMVVLRVCEGWQYDELGRRFDMGAEAVRSRVRRALERMRARLN